jgi:ribosomal protein S1
MYLGTVFGNAITTEVKHHSHDSVATVTIIGNIIRVKVLEVDPERRRIALSRKRASS